MACFDGNISTEEIKYLLDFYKHHRGVDFLFQHNFDKLPQDMKNEIEKLVIQQMSNYRILSVKHSKMFEPYLSKWCAVPPTKEMVAMYHKKKRRDFNILNIYTLKNNTYINYHIYLGGYTMSTIKIEMLSDRFEITYGGYNQHGVNDVYDLIEPYDIIYHDLKLTGAILHEANANFYKQDYIYDHLHNEICQYSKQVENDTQEHIFYNIQKNSYIHRFYGQNFLTNKNIDIIKDYRFKNGLLIQGDVSIIKNIKNIGQILNDDTLKQYY